MSIVFAERLKYLRKKKGYIQDKVAGDIGISKGMLSNYERGAREPDFDMLKKIADYYETTADYLIGYDNSNFPIEDMLDMMTVNQIIKSVVGLSENSKTELLKGTSKNPFREKNSYARYLLRQPLSECVSTPSRAFLAVAVPICFSLSETGF